MEPVAARYANHEEAEKATREYYRRLTPAKRIEILLELIEAANAGADEASKGFARVYRVTQLPRR
jgi:hypothetical protein